MRWRNWSSASTIPFIPWRKFSLPQTLPPQTTIRELREGYDVELGEIKIWLQIVSEGLPYYRALQTGEPLDPDHIRQWMTFEQITQAAGMPPDFFFAWANLPSNPVAELTLGQLEEESGFTLEDDILGSLEELANVLAVLILLAGGLGITAVQLISIRERAWEIGLHRAMGARKKDITGQFLLESAILGAAGGLAGTFLGVVAPLALASAFGLAPYIAWPILLVSLCISVMVGTAAGIYPAYYASCLDPVVALRSA